MIHLSMQRFCRLLSSLKLTAHPKNVTFRKTQHTAWFSTRVSPPDLPHPLLPFQANPLVTPLPSFVLTIFFKSNAGLSELFDDFHLTHSKKDSHEYKGNKHQRSEEQPQKEHKIMPSKQLQKKNMKNDESAFLLLSRVYKDYLTRRRFPFGIN